MMRGVLKLAALALLPVLLLACGTSGDNDEDGSNMSTGGTSEEGRGEAFAADAAEDADGGAAAPAQFGMLDRKIILTSDLELAAEDVTVTFHRAGQIARSAGGYVEQSNLRATDDENSAAVTLRVPASGLDDVLEQLRGMPGVEVHNEGTRSSEVTEEYTDLESRLRNLERTEARYLELLAQADTIEDILTVEDRLNSVRSQIEQIEGRLRVLDDLIDLATVNVLITSLEGGPANGTGGPPTLAEAFGDAWNWSLDAARWAGAAGAYVAVAAAWLAVPLAIAAAVVVRARRRRLPDEQAASS